MALVSVRWCVCVCVCVCVRVRVRVRACVVLLSQPSSRDLDYRDLKLYLKNHISHKMTEICIHSNTCAHTCSRTDTCPRSPHTCTHAHVQKHLPTFTTYLHACSRTDTYVHHILAHTRTQIMKNKLATFEIHSKLLHLFSDR